MLFLIFRWLVTTLAVWIAVEIMPGLEYDRWQTLALAALVLGILNAFVKPILAFLTIPLIIVSFGLFLILINAMLLKWTAFLVPGFTVANWSAALLGGIIILNSAVAGPKTAHLAKITADFEFSVLTLTVPGLRLRKVQNPLCF